MLIDFSGFRNLDFLMTNGNHSRKHHVSTATQRRQSIPKEARVSLDERLIHDARVRTNGANVHQMKELIFAYELAVSLHNDGFLAHKTIAYDSTCEIELRKAVLKSRLQEFHSQFAGAARNIREILQLCDSRSRDKFELS
jgi:hypothetical protein